jgi:hypothetical protein
MKTTRTQSGRSYTPIIVFIVSVLVLGLAERVLAADGTLATRYEQWAGGKPNAEALVQGLRNGTPIAISTRGANGGTSLAGFTPRALKSDAEVSAALQRARASLSRLGIENPSAEQIQAALVGGEVQLRDGASTVLNGAVPAAGSPPATPRVAATR